MANLALGFDIGTYNLIVCNGAEGGPSAFHTQVNAYLHLKDPAPSTKKTLESMGKPILPHGENGKDILVLGKDAIELASDFGSKVKRPMEKGCVSPDEAAFPILSSMLGGMLDKVTMGGEVVLYYSKPANAISQDTNVDLHGALCQGIFDAYEGPTGCKMTSVAMNEAAAVIFSECPDKTGLAISTGAGMVNVAYVKFGVTIFAFSISQSGDFIDSSVAQAVGESEASVNLKKTSVDISKPPKNQFELILKAQYDILIRSSIEKIIEGIESCKGEAGISRPIPLVIAGGVSSIAGFMDVFKDTFSKYKMPIEVSEVKRAEQGVLAVAHGLWEAAKLHDV